MNLGLRRFHAGVQEIKITASLGLRDMRGNRLAWYVGGEPQVARRRSGPAKGDRGPT